MPAKKIKTANLELSISAKKVFLVLLGISILLVVIHVILQYILYYTDPGWGATIINRFDVNEEVTVPTWFSQILLLMAAGLMAIIAASKLRRKMRYRYHWSLLSIIFLYLSIDDGSALHEVAIGPMRTHFDIQNTYLLFAWIIPAAALLVIFLLVYLRFWWRLPTSIKLLFALAFVVFVSGSIGLESISSNHYAIQGGYDYTLALLSAAEEGFEMIGVVILIYALIAYLNEDNIVAKFKFLR